MRSVYLKKENCCGCSACFSICAAHAITMKANEEGFLYSQIDESHCVNCERCTAICPFKHEVNYKHNIVPHFYAARHKSREVLKKSSSGGAFTAVSDLLYVWVVWSMELIMIEIFVSFTREQKHQNSTIK